MRFEAKHNHYKRLGHIVCNFRNILKTLSYRQQMFLCYNIFSRKDLGERDTEVGPGSTALVASLPDAQGVANVLGVHLLDEIYID